MSPTLQKAPERLDVILILGQTYSEKELLFYSTYFFSVGLHIHRVSKFTFALGP